MHESLYSGAFLLLVEDQILLFMVLAFVGVGILVFVPRDFKKSWIFKIIGIIFIFSSIVSSVARNVKKVPKNHIV